MSAHFPLDGSSDSSLRGLRDCFTALPPDMLWKLLEVASATEIRISAAKAASEMLSCFYLSG
jgi:hypothetical protein